MIYYNFPTILIRINRSLEGKKEGKKERKKKGERRSGPSETGEAKREILRFEASRILCKYDIF